MTHIDNPRFRRILIRRGYSYLRHIKGRARRVRITVPPLYAYVAVSELKRARRAPSAAPAPKPKRVLKPKPAPKRVKKPKETKEERILRVRGEYVKKLRRARKRLASIPKLDDAWTSAVEYQGMVAAECIDAGLPINEIDADIAHDKHPSDWVHRDTLFVWPSRRLPTKLVYKTAVKGKPVDFEAAWQTIKVWFLINNLRDHQSGLWVRTSGLDSAASKTWEGLHAIVEGLAAQVTEDLGEFDYIVVRGMVAWTAYPLGSPGHGGTPREPGA